MHNSHTCSQANQSLHHLRVVLHRQVVQGSVSITIRPIQDLGLLILGQLTNIVSPLRNTIQITFFSSLQKKKITKIVSVFGFLWPLKLFWFTSLGSRSQSYPMGEAPVPPPPNQMLSEPNWTWMENKYTVAKHATASRDGSPLKLETLTLLNYVSRYGGYTITNSSETSALQYHYKHAEWRHQHIFSYTELCSCNFGCLKNNAHELLNLLLMLGWIASWYQNTDWVS